MTTHALSADYAAWRFRLYVDLGFVTYTEIDNYVRAGVLTPGMSEHEAVRALRAIGATRPIGGAK
jgi:hypothetical protein